MAASVTGLTDTVDSKHHQGIHPEDKILSKLKRENFIVTILQSQEYYFYGKKSTFI